MPGAPKKEGTPKWSAFCVLYKHEKGGDKMAGTPVVPFMNVFTAFSA
jgi:hypothetical protein